MAALCAQGYEIIKKLKYIKMKMDKNVLKDYKSIKAKNSCFFIYRWGLEWINAVKQSKEKGKKKLFHVHLYQ